MSGKELSLVRDVFKSNWISSAGPDIASFESEFAHYNGSSHALALSSGTAAIHLALRVLGVSRGDEVFCSSFTFCASASPIIYQGAKPVFIDSEQSSWNMDPSLLKKEIERRAKKNKLPKAVIVVHLYGQSADMGAIIEICGKYDIPVIEDAAEALGAKYKNRKTGTFGYCSIFSFNGNKIITTSGGGMLVSEDKNFIYKARFLSNQARDPASHYQHSQIGYNYRMSNILASVGRGQLKVIDKRVNKKRAIFEKYKKLLGDTPGINFMPEPEWSRSNRWLTCITIDSKSGIKPEDIRLHLEKYNIESRPLWKPMHLQPVFKNYKTCGGKISENLFKTGLCLPSGTAMTEKDIEYICNRIIGLKFK